MAENNITGKNAVINRFTGGTLSLNGIITYQHKRER